MTRRKSRQIVLGLMGVGISAFILTFVATRPPAASADTPSVPPASALFDDLELPYNGLGVVWIRQDGLVTIEFGDKKTASFTANVVGLSLVEKGGVVGFYQGTTTGAVVHQFPEEPVAQPAMCSAAFHTVGYLEFDYDEETGVLETRVDGAKQVFEAKFDFANSVVIEFDEQQAQQGAQNTCQASCSYPSQACSASKTCDPGYQCTCRARCGADLSTCTCSACSRIRAEGVVVQPVDPVPVEPEP
jgi:hypothetical protein